MMHSGTSSSYRSVDWIGLWSGLVIALYFPSTFLSSVFMVLYIILKNFVTFFTFYWAEPCVIGPWPYWLTVVLQCCDAVNGVVWHVKSSAPWQCTVSCGLFGVRSIRSIALPFLNILNLRYELSRISFDGLRREVQDNLYVTIQPVYWHTGTSYSRYTDTPARHTASILTHRHVIQPVYWHTGTSYSRYTDIPARHTAGILTYRHINSQYCRISLLLVFLLRAGSRSVK